METRIKIENLDVTREKFSEILSNLEEILNIKPSKEIEELSKKINLDINQKQIYIKGSKIREDVSYRIEFYHINEKEKEYPIGEMNYTPNF